MLHDTITIVTSAHFGIATTKPGKSPLSGMLSTGTQPNVGR